MRIGTLAALTATAYAAPVLAYDGIAIIEGSHLTLLALGVIGVVVGRRAVIHLQRRASAREAESE